MQEMKCLMLKCSQTPVTPNEKPDMSPSLPQKCWEKVIISLIVCFLGQKKKNKIICIQYMKGKYTILQHNSIPSQNVYIYEPSSLTQSPSCRSLLRASPHYRLMKGLYGGLSMLTWTCTDRSPSHSVLPPLSRVIKELRVTEL